MAELLRRLWRFLTGASVPHPAPTVPPLAPHRGASRDRSLSGKARIRARRAGVVGCSDDDCVTEEHGR